MKKPKKPEVCDGCMENEELHWSEDEGMWICDLCEEAFYEERSIYEMELQDSFDAMLDEEMMEMEMKADAEEQQREGK